MFDELTRRLEAEGCHLIFDRQFIGYDKIFKEIETCDGLLAIIDGDFWSSTWRVSETTFASGNTPSDLDRRFVTQPLPVFIMPIPDDFHISFFGRMKTAIILPPSPDDAVKTAIEHFTKSRYFFKS